MASTPSLLAAFALAVLLAACGPSEISSVAEACAKVVGQVRGAPERVEVTGSTATAEGQVEIDYEYADRENIPTTGAAACNFALGGGGKLELVEGFVDGQMLDAAQMAAANRALSAH